MQLEYITPFVGSLIVALVTVWFAHSLGDKANRKRALGNLYAEVLANIKVSEQICELVQGDFRAKVNGETGLPPYPHLDRSAWDSAKGTMTLSDYSIARQLDYAYLLIGIINDLMCRVEDMRYRLRKGFILPEEQHQKEVLSQEFAQNIAVVDGFVIQRLLPTLEEARTLLQKSLNLQHSKATN